MPPVPSIGTFSRPIHQFLFQATLNTNGPAEETSAPSADCRSKRLFLPFPGSECILAQQSQSISFRLPFPRSGTFCPIRRFLTLNSNAPAEDKEDEEDGSYGNYGDFPPSKLLGMGDLDLGYSEMACLSPEMQGQIVLVRGRVQVTRSMGKKLVFLVLRDTAFSIQCTVNGTSVGKDMVQNTSLQNLEIQVRKLFCINRRLPSLPYLLDDQIDRAGQQVSNSNSRALELRNLALLSRLSFPELRTMIDLVDMPG